MESVRPQLLRAYQPLSYTGLSLRGLLKYDPSSLNIAIHSHTGDLNPTPPNLQAATLRKILKQLGHFQEPLPISLWIFSEDPASLLGTVQQEKLGDLVGDLAIHSDTSNMSAMLSFVHPLESDITIGSDSSFSWFAGYLSQQRPLFFAAPNFRELQEFQNWMEGSIRVSPAAAFDDRGRIKALRKLWRATQPFSLQPCVSNIFWGSLPKAEKLRAQPERLTYMADYPIQLAMLQGTTGHKAFDISPAPPPSSARLSRGMAREIGAPWLARGMAESGFVE